MAGDNDIVIDSNTVIKNFNSAQQITNKNLLSPIEYKFNVLKLPYTSFFVQQVNLPGISLGRIPQPTPFVPIPIQGDHIVFNPLTLTFRVDEDLANWQELYTWIRSSGVLKFPEYRQISSQPKTSGAGLKSELTLHILSDRDRPNFTITLHDGWPFALTDLNFDTQDTSINYLQATVQFTYTYYDIEKTV